MKKILFTISILLLFCQVSYAAIGAAVDWDFQPGVGSNNNGGGFKIGATGTDYSTAATPYIVLTDAEVKGGVYTRVYSATANLNDSKLVGNIMCVVSGTNFTAGLYEITAVGTDGDDYMDIDRNCASGNSNDGVANIGGTRAVFTDAFFEALTAGNDVYVKSGTMTLTENLNVAKDGVSSSDRNEIIGYDTTHDDTCDSTDRPIIITGAYTFTFDNYWLIKNLHIITVSSTGVSLDTYAVAENCKIENFSSSADYPALNFSSTTNGIALSNELVSIKGMAFWYGSGTLKHAKANYLHSSKNGIYTVGNALSNASIMFSIFENITSTAIESVLSQRANVEYNTFNKCVTAYSDSGAPEDLYISNNIFNDSSIESITLGTASTSNLLNYNNFYGNTSDVTNITKRCGNIALDPEFTFVAPAGTDDSGVADKATSMVDTSENFVTLGVTVGKTIYNTTDCSVGTITSISTTTNPNDTINFSGGLTNGTDNDFDNGDTYTITPGNYAVGANMKAAGFPGTFPGGGSTGYMDIGAVQREEQGGGEYSYGYAY